MKISIKKASVNMSKAVIHIRNILADKRGEGMVDIAISVMISVVLGALVLAGLYLLFKSNIMPVLTQKVQDMFNYQG